MNDTVGKIYETMSFTLFRILVLVWNNSPDWLQKLYRLFGLTGLVHAVWVPYRNLPVPPSERPFRSFLEKLIQPGWRCVDVGANYGMMTEVMALRVGPSGSVTAFEAHPFNASILSRRMEMQGFKDRVVIENQAVSDGLNASLALYAGRRRSPNEWNVVGHDVLGRTTKAVLKIPSTSLDAYFDETPIHLVKIDVEGAEIGVIAGMKGILARQKPVCLVEFHSSEAWESRQAFLEAGYQIFSLDGKLLSGDCEWKLHVLLWPPGPAPIDRLFTNSIA